MPLVLYAWSAVAGQRVLSAAWSLVTVLGLLAPDDLPRLHVRQDGSFAYLQPHRGTNQ